MVSKSQLALILSLAVPAMLFSQPGSIRFDEPTLQRIPGIVAATASPTHLYVLSEYEGMVVYRTRPDTLQWLFTSEGMTNRGRQLSADTRFAYLFGSDTRISILEPTSLQGVYTSVYLPAKPKHAVRYGSVLFVNADNGGIYGIPLSNPADAERYDTLAIDGFMADGLTHMIAFSRQILAVSGRQLHFLDVIGNQLRLADSQRLQQEVTRLHDLNGILFASNSRGELFEVRSGGSLRNVLDVREPIETVYQQGNHYYIRAISGKAWVIHTDGRTIAHRPNPESGNHIALVNNRIWMSNHEQFGRVTVTDAAGERPASTLLKIKPIENQILLQSRPLLVALELDGDYASSVRFDAKSETATPIVRGNGLFWQPAQGQSGPHRITVTAISSNGQRDSTSFTVDVRTFNQPPRFNPLRPITIPVGEAYQLPIRAIDPDGLSQDHVRYVAYDLPSGSTLSERNGLFNWTPDMRQVGVHRFRVVATDASGASSEIQVQITVRTIDLDNR